MAEIAMPKLSDSMEDGTILAWLAADGADVAVGEELVEIETDKATTVFGAEHSGVLKTLVAEGEVVAVGTVIATVGAPVPAAIEPPAAVADGDRPAAAARAGDERILATPVARRIAGSAGISLEQLAGSGPGGRIRKRDVEAVIESGATAAPAAEPEHRSQGTELAPVGTGPEPVTSAKGERTVVELSSIEQRISRRMAESKATVPDFSLQMEVRCAALIALRAKLREIADPAPSLNDLVIKAVAVALRSHPRVNGSYRDGAVDLYEKVNIGVAVASDRGLFVPTVFDADRIGLAAIASRVRGLATAVRDGSIAAGDLGGGTFTISNLGMFGVARFTAVINPPQAAILAVGTMRERLELEDGEVRSVPVMDLTLCCDHRVLDGAAGAAFLKTLSQLLEEPLTMAL